MTAGLDLGVDLMGGGVVVVRFLSLWLVLEFGIGVLGCWLWYGWRGGRFWCGGELKREIGEV